ncbi:MAG TPA: trypsin-like serine protease [Streptosporangiaceae bacterium]|jgi:V8-like Glu-specific endopeptidase
MQGRGELASGQELIPYRPAALQPRRRWRSAWIAAAVTLLMTLVAVLWPMTAAPSALVPMALVQAIPAARTPAVGALFSVSGGRLGSHFCTASVVDSPAGNLILTAAHCLAAYPGAGFGALAFVPAYDKGAAPYGVWKVTRVFVDSAWASSADPDHDVAFLTVAHPRGGKTIEEVTGGERLGIDQPSGAVVRVSGYPNTQDEPISCQNRTLAFSSTQLEFDCDHFTNGTSGSPFLIDTGAAIGGVTVIGVIGGYQEGGDSADISYAAVFGRDVKALYETAVAGS